MKKLFLLLLSFITVNVFAVSMSHTVITIGGEQAHQFEVTDPSYMPAYYFDGFSYPPDGWSYLWHTDEGHISSAEKPIFFFATAGAHTVSIVLTPRKKGEDENRVRDNYTFNVFAADISTADHTPIADVPFYMDGEARLGDKVYIVIPLNSCDVITAPHSYKFGFNSTRLSYNSIFSQSGLTFSGENPLSDLAMGEPINSGIEFSYMWSGPRTDIAVVLEFDVLASADEPIAMKFYGSDMAQCVRRSEHIAYGIRGPYDPNFKESDVQDVNVFQNPDQKVAPTQVEYTIHFQNIGSGPVDSITIVDILPTYLSFVSFNGSSHDALLSTTNASGTLTWKIAPSADVKGINEYPTQPDPSTKGWVKFLAEIAPEQGITYDTCYCLCNTATIYFDSLAPIQTKADIIAIGDSLCFAKTQGSSGELTTAAAQICYNESKYYKTASIAVKPTKRANLLSIYPNPTNGILYFENLIGTYNVEIYNTVGMLMYAEMVSQSAINVGSLPSGSYVIKVIDSKSQYFARLIKY